MKARTLLIPGALACAGGFVWLAWSLGAGAERSDDARAPTGVERAGTRAALERPAIDDAGADGADVGPELALEPPERTAEITLSDADALRAVRGIVLDARTKEPVSGLALSFLSRRPRTCTVVTDARGGFATGPELACGVVSAQHAPDALDARVSARWELEPNQFVLAPRDPRASADETPSVVFFAREPERVLEVDIRLPDGLPAEGAAVSVTWGERAENGAFLPVARDYEEADAAGRARFPFVDAPSVSRSLRVEAEQGGTLASDVLTLEPPIAPRPLALALHAGGVVRVRCRNDEGRPIAGVSTYLAVHEDARAARGWHGTTDATGEGLFTALRAGCYTVSALHPLTGERVERTVDLARGEHEVVDVRLGVAGLRPALVGQVLDEYGYPLPGVELRVTRSSGEAMTLASGDKGQFEFWSKPEPELLLGVGGGIADDRFEPEETTVPFGTRGIVLRRAQILRERTLAFEIVDRTSKEPLRSARVALFLGDADRAGAREIARFDAPTGVVQSTFKLRPELGYVIEAPEHVRVTGRVAELLQRDPARIVARIALERGFERELVVRDRPSGRPLARVRVALGERELARTDAEGRVELSLPAWPPGLRFEGAGFLPCAWDPLSAPFPGDVVWLDPLR
ncbi:MAG: carboxypeptidase regulatory-like domain-containing protein [Planctomycetes bacterium]|nr:carboxypeptidase regulatory-like domain-containing protein [Planctomycetota bacterium]